MKKKRIFLTKKFLEKKGIQPLTITRIFQAAGKEEQERFRLPNTPEEWLAYLKAAASLGRPRLCSVLKKLEIPVDLSGILFYEELNKDDPEIQAFDGAILDNASFWRMNLTHRSFLGCKGKGTNFTEANLSHGNMSDSVFEEADFLMTQMVDIHLNHCRFIACNFMEARLEEALVYGSSFPKSYMFRTDFRYALLQKTSFQTSLSLSEAIFGQANLKETGLLVACISGRAVLCTPDRLHIGCNSEKHEYWQSLTPEEVEDYYSHLGGHQLWPHRELFYQIMEYCRNIGWPEPMMKKKEETT